MNLLRVLAIAIAIPAVGFVISSWIISDINSDLVADGVPPAQQVCAVADLIDEPELQNFCADFRGIQLLRTTSIYTGMLGLLIPVLFTGASMLVGKNRKRMALIFPKLVTLSIVLLGIMVLSQGAVLTYAAYLGESYAIGSVHFFIIGAVALGALAAGISLLSAGSSLRHSLRMPVLGRKVSPDEAPTLHGAVKALAERLGARAPEHIVVGLEPNFFVTSADIMLVGQPVDLKGESLFVSSSLSRLLSVDEFTAVLGHELGHFRGKDTEYSMKFAPVYAGLVSGIHAVASAENEGAAALAKLPALSVLSYMIEVFAGNERTIGRERELLADRAGAEAAGAEALARALVKVALYSQLWEKALIGDADRLNKGKVSRNLSAVFSDSARYDVEHESLEKIRASVLEARIVHPTDTHPPVKERLEALGVPDSCITKEALQVSENSAIALLDNHRDVEEALTLIAHKRITQSGYVAIPKRQEEPDLLLRSIYSLGAAVILADGRIDQAEIATAEHIGKQMFEEFDPVEFREICGQVADLPDATRVSEILGETLQEDERTAILRYLKRIASADGHVSAVEDVLLARLASNLRLLEPLEAKEASKPVTFGRHTLADNPQLRALLRDVQSVSPRTELDEPVPKPSNPLACSECGAVYRRSDYRSDAEKWLCTQCGAKIAKTDAG